MEQGNTPPKSPLNTKKILLILFFIFCFFLLAWGMQKILPQDFSASLIHANAMDASISNISLRGATEPVFSGGGLKRGLEILSGYIPGLGIIESGSIIETVFYLIKIVLILSGLIAFIAFLWAGVLYLTTFLKADNNETAKKVMIYAAIGILVILLSYAIVHFLTTLNL